MIDSASSKSPHPFLISHRHHHHHLLRFLSRIPDHAPHRIVPFSPYVTPLQHCLVRAASDTTAFSYYSTATSNLHHWNRIVHLGHPPSHSLGYCAVNHSTRSPPHFCSNSTTVRSILHWPLSNPTTLRSRQPRTTVSASRSDLISFASSCHELPHLHSHTYTHHTDESRKLHNRLRIICSKDMWDCHS